MTHRWGASECWACLKGCFGNCVQQMAAMNPCISSFLHYIPAMLNHSRAAPPFSFPHKVKNINLKQKNEKEGKFLKAGTCLAWLVGETGSFGWSIQSPERIPSSVSPPALQHIWDPTQEQPWEGALPRYHVADILQAAWLAGKRWQWHSESHPVQD